VQEAKTTTMSSSTLVNIAEDAEHRLVGLLSSPSSPVCFKEECEASIANGDASKLVRTIVRDPGSIQSLLSAPMEEGISAVALLAACLNKVKDGSSGLLLKDVADAIVTVTHTDCSTSTSKQMTLLATLYNMRSDPFEKVDLLTRMIRLASTHDPTLLEGNSSLGKWMEPSRLTGMLDEWQIPASGRRELYRAAADGSNSSLIRQQFTLLIVETYSKSDVDSTGLEYAQKAAIGAIRDPFSLFAQQRKILSLPAIEALGQSDGKFLQSTLLFCAFGCCDEVCHIEKYVPELLTESSMSTVFVAAKLLVLLKVFQEGKIEDYFSFIESNGGDGVLTRWSLSGEDCGRFMRILSLCSLAAEHEVIPYSLVAETLQATDGEVEKWVIAAVSSGLLSAKMDQLEQKVMVERSVVRQFDMKEWKALQERVHLWKKNVRGILDVYKQSLESQFDAPT
jgi:translation initiation factor 3 subunit M